MFTLVFELARPKKIAKLQTNRHIDKIINISKNINFFSSLFYYNFIKKKKIFYIAKKKEFFLTKYFK